MTALVIVAAFGFVTWAIVTVRTTRRQWERDGIVPPVHRHQWRRPTGSAVDVCECGDTRRWLG